MAFRLESDLAEVARSSPQLRQFFDTDDYRTVPLVEPRGLFGVPDVVYATVDLNEGQWVCEQTKALEMKLRNWKRALQQAFRYRSFANVSYVVLDAAHAAPAIRSLARFKRSNVGLITVDTAGTVTVYYEPAPSPPVCERMSRKLSEAVWAEIGEDFPT